MCVFLLAAPPFFVPPLSLCPLFQGGWTALIQASLFGHAKVVELLLAAKADTNLQSMVSPLPPQRERERTKDPLPPTLARALPPSRRGHMCPRGFGHEAPCVYPLGRQVGILVHHLDVARISI